MNVADIKFNLFHNLENLSESLLIELRKMIDDLLAKKQKNTSTPSPRKPREFGCMKGLVIYMAPDFDAPLEDFKDYM